MRTVHIYGTVYNNAKIASMSVRSLLEMDFNKKIYVVDNFSTDGSYEELNKLSNTIVVRQRTSRGLGRQVAMDIACKNAHENDLLMSFDLDTTYTPEFEKIVKCAIKSIERDQVYPSFLCLKETSCKVPWKDLNNGEDWERQAHFASLGVKAISFPNYRLTINQAVEFHREFRYSSGLHFYYRLAKNTVDLIRGWGIDSFKKLKEYLLFVKPKTTLFRWAIIIIPITLFFVYCKLFTDIFSYGDTINRYYPVFDERDLTV